jgi:hypothetical protein
LESAFQEWTDRLVQCSVALGNLVEGT